MPAVECAAEAGWLRRCTRLVVGGRWHLYDAHITIGRPAERAIEDARDRQQRIAHNLGLHTAAVLPPQQTVVLIDRGWAGPEGRGLLVGGRSQDLAMQRLQRVVGSVELPAQPVEELRVTR